ncbi:MAG: 30S ribosomal protein S4 [Kiritimatiellae bacterium]|nr:30S ribosomal protein S4 [Kiritimatiellia bacterium]MBR4476983.1 30S ribosomal protein S4 [Kiritimatiellia bacterium]
MGHFTGPRSKIARRFGEPVFGPDKVLEKRPYAPGQHGANKRRKKMSEYGVQLREKQKAKAIYGMREKQFRLFFERAKSKAGVTGDAMLAMCETRLDNIVYRLGFSPTRAGARQLVTHRHVTVNGKVCGIPSYIVRPGEVVSVREKDRDMIAVVDSLKQHKSPAVTWLAWDEATMQGTLISSPERVEIPESIDMQLIVEFFSR